MEPAQLDEAERLVAEWEPNPAECETIGAQAENCDEPHVRLGCAPC